MRWTRKDLLGLRELSADEINFILETADAFKQVGTREIKKVPALRGKTLVNFFVEPSTRTRISFELAALRLSADVINISAATSSLTKGETLKDTARNLEALLTDIIVLRHSSAGAPQFLATRLKASVINAGDGAHEHPTQALLDLYTIREKRGKIAGLHVVIIGDILFQPRRALEYFRSNETGRARHSWSVRARSCRASLKSSASPSRTRSTMSFPRPTW